MTFSPDEYFASRAQRDVATPDSIKDLLNNRTTKLDEVMAASKEKMEVLQSVGLEKKAKDLASASSLVGKLGLDPESITGEAVNLGASVFSGASRLAGDVSSLVAGDIPAMWNDAKLTEEQKQLLGRVHRGEATPEEVAQANTRIGDNTPEQIYQQAIAARARSVVIDKAFDQSGTVHSSARDQLGLDLGKDFQGAWDQVKTGASALGQGDSTGTGDLTVGIAKLIFNAAKAGVTNPRATAEYVAENAPQLLLGGAGKVGQAAMLLTNIGYASEYYQKGITKFQAENGGAYPPEDQRTRMALYAASLAAAEHAGSLFELNAAKGAADALEETGKHGLMQSLKHTAEAALEGGAEETATEAYQSFGEGEASLTPASAQDIYEGGAIGGLSGAGLSGGGRAVGELTKTTPEHVAAQAAQQVQQATRAQAQVEAVKTGDVSALVDPKAPTYDPAAAVAALHGHASLDTTTPEVRQAKLEEAGKIVAELQAKRDKLQEVYDSGTPETLAQAQQLLDTHTARMAAIDPADTAAVQAQQDNIDMAQGMVNDVKVAPPAELKRQKAQIDKLDANLTQANEYMGRFQKDTSTKVDEEAAVQTLSQPVTESSPEVHAKAAETVINLSMASPDRVNGDTAVALADNKANGLNEGQRTYLREYAAARNLDGQLQDMKAVDQQVYAGGNGNVGIAQYRSRIAAALATGNQAQADQQLAQLAKFQASHEAKAAVFAQALQQGLGTTTVQTKDGQWQIEDPAKPIPEARVKQRKVINSRAWVNAVQTEAKAIAATHQEMSSAYALKFSNAQQGAAHVQVVPQAHGQATNQPAVHPAPQGAASVAAPAAGPAVTAGAGHVAGPAVVADPQLTPAVSSTAVDQASHDAVTAGRDEGQNQSKNSTETAPSQSEELAGEGRTSPESAEQTSEKTAPAGQLTAMGQQSPEETAPHHQNPLPVHFTQEAGREGGTSQRPLVAVRNFLDALIAKTVKVSDFLGEQTLSEPQRAAIQGFLKQARAWQTRIQENLPQRKKPDFMHDDMMQFLLTHVEGEASDIDQNVKMALSYAVYSWAAENASNPRFNKAKVINGILGRSKDKYVSSKAWELLGPAGSYQHLLTESLGGRAMDVLGLKAKKSAPQNLEPKLRAALGSHALKLLEDEGLVTRTTVSGEQMAFLRKEGLKPKQAAKIKTEAGTHTFFAIARNSDGSVVADLQHIQTSLKGTQRILERLFSVEPAHTLPSLEPIRSLPATTEGTRQGVPEELKAVLLKNQSRPRQVRTDTLDLFGQFSEDDLHAMMGVTEEEDKLTHRVNRMSTQAKNDGLKREYANFIDWVGEYLATSKDGLKTPFYLPFSPWKQQRVGIASTVVNPQTSKIHRFLVTSAEWQTEVDPKDERLMTSFFLRVGEGLGVKTERADNEESVELVKTRLKDPVYAKGVAALVKSVVNKGTLTEEEKGDIVAAVNAGGENLHTLDALIGVAQFQAAEGKPFTVQMMGEVDGVANGTMLNHVLMGAKGSVEELQAFANQGGFYEIGHKHSQYNQWRGDPEAQNLDVYESTARALYKTLAQMWGEKGNEQLDAIWTISGAIFVPEHGTVTKDGRNFVKDACNPLAFGMSVDNVVEGMADVFLSNVYKRFEKLSSRGASQAEVDAVVKAINALMPDAEQDHLPLGRPIDWHMEQVLKPGMEADIRAEFIYSVGEAVKHVVEQEFSVFLQRRDALNKTAQLTFSIYNAVYEGERKAAIADLVAAGKLLVDKNGDLLGDLTKPQEAEINQRLKDILPVIQTAMSHGDLGSGLLMAKTKRKPSREETYLNETKFGAPLANGGKQMGVHGYAAKPESPGVAMGSATTHSLDSSISHRVQAERDVLNIHDALGDGVGGLEASARLLNQNTWNSLLTYSPLEEAHQSLSRVIVGLAKLVESNQLSPQAIVSLQDFLRKEADKFWVKSSASSLMADSLEASRATAHAADTTRLEFLKVLAHLDQYAYQGGNYEVTDADRAQAEKQLKGLVAELSKEETAALETLKGFMKIKPEVETATPVHQREVEVPGEQAETGPDENQQDAGDFDLETLDAPVTASPFGPLGRSQVASDPALVSLLKGSPAVRDVIRTLLARTGEGNGRISQFNHQLLRLLAKTVPADTTVQLVTPQTDPKSIKEPPKQPSHAWIVTGKPSSIYVLSPEFAHSGLTTETLLHELTHAALVQAIANPTAETKPLIAELDELRQRAKNRVANQGIKGFDAALVDLHEFIAYGMTNQAFQRQVLSQITMPSKTAGNVLVNGMKAFISRLTGILFHGSTKTEQQQAENGLTTLISNVSGLFNQVGTEATAADGVSLNLSMASNPIGTLNTFSTLDIHAALPGGSISPEFDAHLRDVLGGIVAKLHGTFGSLKESMMANQALTPLDVWTKALATGKAPFASLTQIAPMTISERERHAMEQVEVTVSEALSHNETSTKQAARELKRLYEEMRETVKPTDFNSQDEYDFVFEVAPNAAGFSDHLARFAAFGLANEQFAKIMKSKTTATTRKVRDGKGFAERFQIIFEKVLEFFHGDLAHSFGGQNAGAKLTQLVDKLVDVEAKRRSTLATPTNLSLFDQAANAVGTKSKQALNSVVNSKWVGGNSNVFIRAAGGLVKIAANQQVMQALDVINDLRDKYTNETHGFLAGWMNDIRGPGQKFNALQLLVTNVQRIRHKLASDMEKFVPKAFANPESLTEKASAAMSKVFLRTGMHFLVREGRMNMVELENVLTNKTARDAAISTLEGELRAVGAAVRNHYINHANALAYYTATGLTIKKTMMLNAHNIARMRDVLGNHVSEAQAKQAEKTIEQLVALYAIDYLDSKDLKEAVKVLHEENARTDAGNGVEFTLKMHDKLIEDARARLFEGQEALMLHGYVPEILNPHTKTQVANAAEGQELRYQGYVYAGPVQNDPADPNQEVRGLYVLRDGGMAQRVTGSMSWSGKNAKGTKQTNGYMNVNSPDGLDNAKLHNKIMAQKMTSTLDTGPRVNLAKVKSRSYMTPIVNAQGQITNWRYMMSAKTRDQVLERTNDFGRLLGALAGSTFDKQTTPQTNAKVVAALKEVWDEQKGTHPRSFVEIGPASQDPELVEIWRMLPDETRAQVRKVFGNGSMYVRKDLVTTVFGYRKASIGDIFEKDATMRNALEKVFVWSLENILGTLGHGAARLAKDPDAKDLALNAAKRAAITAVRGERIWQGIVHEAKDIIVVRSGVVMLNNLKSNTMMLAAEGVRPKAIATGMLVAMRGARDYQAHTEELAELQAKLDTKTAGINKPAVERRIAELHDAIARNPIKEIIDMGLMPTISEDVGQEDPYAFKNFYTQKVDEIKDKVVSHLNPTVVKAVKTAYIAKDTAIYQGLSRITQLSDFAARYVLFKHLTERAENPLSKADAAFQASEDFINYDVPMHKGMQYMDDMGFLMFIKYFNRMQRVVWRVSKENPGRVLSSVLVHHFAGFIPSVLESSWMTHFGNNPFSGGATQFVGALGELGTVSSVVRLLK